MNIVSDEGDPCHEDTDMRTDGMSDEVITTIMMSKNRQRKSKRTPNGRTKRSRSHSIVGRCSSSSSSSSITLIKSRRKYPTIRSPPTTRYHGNYWIRIKPVAVRRNQSVVEQSKNPTFFKEQQVPSLKDEEEQQLFLRRGIDADNDIFPLLSSTTVRRVSKSASFNDEWNDLHIPSISPFACCQLWRQSGSSSGSSTNNYIHPKNSIVFFGESGKPVIIRPKSAYVVR